MAILVKDAEDLKNRLAEVGYLLVYMQLNGARCLPCNLIIPPEFKELANQHVIVKTTYNNNEREYRVVHLIELPFEGIDDFIRRPISCLIVCRAKDQMAVDAYPKNKDGSVTGDRFKIKERCNDDCRFYTLKYKYKSDTYRGAQQWIVREMIRLLSNKESKATETQPIDDSRKALLRPLIKRSAPSEPKKEPAEKKRCLMNTKMNLDVAEQNPSNLMDQTDPTKAPNSIRKALLTTHNKNLLNEKQLQANQSKHALVIENHIDVKDNVPQKDEWMENETLPRRHGIIWNSNAVPYNDVISDHQNMYIDDAPIESTKNFYCSEIASESRCADRPIAAQNFTFPNQQAYPCVVLMQKILEYFNILFTQMTSTLHYICDLYNYLLSSIRDCVELYEKLLGAVEDFNTAESLISNASPPSNLTPKVSQSPLVSNPPIQVPPRANSNSDNQHSNKVANKEPKTEKNNNSWRFVLPPEYDPNDTRWTLIHLKKKSTLEELMPETGIYVSSAKLQKYVKNEVKYRSFARNVLRLVFKRCALSVCLSMTEKTQVSDNFELKRPELDEHACTVLLIFVIEHARKRRWKTDLKSILGCLHSEIQRLRHKYGIYE